MFLYDKMEDKGSAKQATLRRSGRGRVKNGKVLVPRVIGFWCFCPGVGFKQIAALHPRSIILTSGTLSPLQSFEAEL